MGEKELRAKESAQVAARKCESLDLWKREGEGEEERRTKCRRKKQRLATERFVRGGELRKKASISDRITEGDLYASTCTMTSSSMPEKGRRGRNDLLGGEETGWAAPCLKGEKKERKESFGRKGGGCTQTRNERNQNTASSVFHVESESPISKDQKKEKGRKGGGKFHTVLSGEGH